MNHTRGVYTGFTLIELIIVVAIMAIMVMVAVPNYSEFITRGNRTDGMQALILLANAQENFYIANQTYADDMEDLPISRLSPDGHYRLIINSGNASGFSARANPKPTASITTTSRQIGDGRLQINSVGEKLWDCEDDGSFSCDWDQK